MCTCEPKTNVAVIHHKPWSLSVVLKFIFGKTGRGIEECGPWSCRSTSGLSLGINFLYGPYPALHVTDGRTSGQQTLQRLMLAS